MKDTCTGLVVLPDDADAEMVEAAVREVCQSVVGRAADEGAVLIGPLNVELLRHESVYDLDGNLVGYQDAIRVCVECDRPRRVR